jgi:hypothetical protein
MNLEGLSRFIKHRACCRCTAALQAPRNGWTLNARASSEVVEYNIASLKGGTFRGWEML